jgi:hypothetical protein
LVAVAVRTCGVSFLGERGVRHSVEVTADTLYQAAAQAIAMFKGSCDRLADSPVV